VATTRQQTANICSSSPC